MRTIDQLKGFLQFTKIVSRYKTAERIYQEDKMQCSTVSIFKFSEKYLLDNPAFTKKAQDLFSENDDKTHENLEQLLLDELDHISKTSPTLTDNTIDLLYIQRTTREGDRHSGQVAFPGGKNDEGESDIQAGLREVEEEIGLKMLGNPDYILLGKFPKNWFAYTKRGKQLKISLLVYFCLTNLTHLQNLEESPLNPKNMVLSKNEVESVWWVPFNYFFLKHDSSTLYQITSRGLSKGNMKMWMNMLHPTLKRNFEANMKERFIQNKIRSQVYMMSLPNDRILWGITMFFTAGLVRMNVFEGMEELNYAAGLEFSQKGKYQFMFCEEDEELSNYIGYIVKLREQTLDMEPYMHGFIENPKL